VNKKLDFNHAHIPHIEATISSIDYFF